MMQTIVEYAALIFVAACAIAIGIVAVINFIKQPRDEQKEALREWLLWAVTEAEKTLGAGTGQLKLRYVYNLALKEFPWLSFISFDWFSDMVDEVLETMRNQIKINDKIRAYVEGDAE